MLLNKEVNFALNYALNKGFQIHPNALEVLERVDVKDLERIIKDIVREKSKKKQYLINQNDLEEHLGLKPDEELKDEYRVLEDPSPNITSAEGVQGYKTLFESRFKKLKNIVSTRPESQMIKSIASILAAKSKDEMYVCGLLSERRVERNVTKLIIDDPTGSLDTIVFDKDLQKSAESLLTDQFVIQKIILGKNGGYIVKDLIVPDIPEHAPNRSED